MKETHDTIVYDNPDYHRRSGNSTRQIDKAVQIIFSGHKCIVHDHWNGGTGQKTNQDLFSRILNRIHAEHHAWFPMLKVDKEKFTIEIADSEPEISKGNIYPRSEEKYVPDPQFYYTEKMMHTAWIQYQNGHDVKMIPNPFYKEKNMGKAIKYKLLRDTPLVEAGTIFSQSELGEYYYPEGYEQNTDYGFRPEVISMKTWFEPINPFSPLESEWVYNEKTGTAVQIIREENRKSNMKNCKNNHFMRLHDCEASIEAVKENPQAYKRYATTLEVEIACMMNVVLKNENGHDYLFMIIPDGTLYLKDGKVYIGNIIDIWNHLKPDLWSLINKKQGQTGAYKILIDKFLVGCTTWKIFDLEKLILQLRAYHEVAGSLDSLNKKLINK